MATVDKLPSGKWRVRWRAPGGARHFTLFDRKGDATEFGKLKESEILRGVYINPRDSKMPFEEWADEWFKSRVALKPKTLAGYKSLHRTHLHPEFEGVPLGAIRPITVRDWISALTREGMSPARLRQIYQLFSAMMKGAVEADKLARTPCIGVKLPKVPKREMRFLSAEEVATLAQAIRPPYETLVYTLAYGGLRWGEAAGLRRGRVSIGRLEIVETLSEVGGRLYEETTKTYETRRMVLPGFLRYLLGRHIKYNVKNDERAFVFRAPTGGPLRHQNFYRRVWQPAVEAAGILPGFRIHDLRHTCAALLISQGAHIKAVQNHLGHSSIQVTLDHYGHLYEADLEQLAAGLEATYRRASRSG
jgi:integrase